MKLTYHDTFVFKGDNYEAQWFDIPSIDEMPDLPWKQVWAVGNLNGMVPVVFYKDNSFTLPGGSTEPGETVEVTLRRELIEELNCKVISWVPIGYQENLKNGVHDCYQLRIYAVLEKLGEFESDPADTVKGYKLIKIDELNKTLGWGDIGVHMQDVAKKLMQL